MIKDRIEKQNKTRKALKEKQITIKRMRTKNDINTN